MATLVVPYRPGGKTRLGDADVARAMLEDVLAAARPLGRTLVADGPSGQGEAVASALAAVRGPVAIVNADVPSATTDEIAQLLDAAPALVAARDGTTNALALPDASLFRPLYGAGSADRFARVLGARRLDLPGLRDDVDTPGDLERLRGRVGPNTRTALETRAA